VRKIRSLKTLCLACLLIFASAIGAPAQNPAQDASTAALLQRVEELERSLASIKAELAQRSATAPGSVTALGSVTAPGSVTALAAAPAVPPAAPLVAALPPEDDSHTLGPLQFRGYSDLGFGRALFEKMPSSGLAGSPQSFTIGDFDLFVTSKINSHLTFLGEALITSDFTNDFGAEMDRLMLTYTVDRHLQISAGKFNTAIGYYTNEFHRARYFQTATGRPLLFADEDNGGILPVHSIGLSATGELPSGHIGLHWVAELANGRASRHPDAMPIQNFVDENSGKAFNLALYARPEGLSGFETGMSFYRDRLYPEGFSAVEQKIYSAHVAFVKPHLELLGEGVLMKHESIDSHHNSNILSSYLQASYQMGLIRPFFRYDYQNVPGSDPIFGSLGREGGPSVGIRYNFSDFGAFKLQYGRLGIRAGQSTNDVQAQLAFAF
jgi:hypothetical protein